MENRDKNTSNLWAIQLTMLLPVILVTSFYLNYVANAWFWADDFVFLDRYKSPFQHIIADHLLGFGNLDSRIISRAAYWFLGWRLFADNAQYYYIFNLFLIISCSCFIYKTFSALQGYKSGIIASPIYYCLPGVVYSYSWLSSSQHLIPHFFVLLFVYIYSCHRHVKMSSQTAILLFCIFLVGMSQVCLLAQDICLAR